MPYYQCPKCGGRDTYQGTELVSGSSGGGAIIGPENDLGFSPVMKTGGKKTIDQVTVVKCKKCDIILGDKDVKHTVEERRRDIQQKKINDEAFRRVLLKILIITVVIGFITLTIIANL